jgi:hypothetical protein
MKSVQVATLTQIAQTIPATPQGGHLDAVDRTESERRSIHPLLSKNQN